MTADDILGQKLIDGIIPEPLGGAHGDREAAFAAVKTDILKHLRKLRVQNPDKRIDARVRVLRNGVVQADWRLTH